MLHINSNAKNNKKLKSPKITEDYFSKAIIDELLSWAYICWKDVNSVYLGCNKIFTAIEGVNSQEDIIGKTDYDLSWRSMADQIIERDKRVITSGIPEHFLEHAIDIEFGGPIILGTKIPLYNENKEIIGVLTTGIDIKASEASTIAEIKEKEEESKRIVMVHAGSIAHDIRTPLVYLDSINFQLEKVLPVLLRCYEIVNQQKIDIGYPLSKKEIEYIDKILELPKIIEAFIADVQMFINDNLKAIQRSTSSHLEKEDLVMCTSYKGIANALKAYPFKQNDQELVSWDYGYYFDFLGNPMMFLRILFNLLNNAFYQIHKNGKGKIFISSEQEGNKNIIRFKDTAGGAAAEIVKYIFEGYKTTKSEGTGVGLAFCKVTMQSFGGDITCHSVEGDYMEFVLSFPKMTE